MSKLKKHNAGKDYVGALEETDLGTKLADHLEISAQDTMFARRQIIQPIHQGLAEYYQNGTYNPIIIVGVFYTLKFPTINLENKSIFHQYPNNQKIEALIPGYYRVSAGWGVSFSSTATIEPEYCDLWLYKNGAVDKQLGYYNLRIPNGIGGYGYLDFAWLEGTKGVELDRGDYIEIRFRHASTNNYDTSVTHAGYVTINYEGPNG